MKRRRPLTGVSLGVGGLSAAARRRGRARAGRGAIVRIHEEPGRVRTLALDDERAGTLLAAAAAVLDAARAESAPGPSRPEAPRRRRLR